MRKVDYFIYGLAFAIFIGTLGGLLGKYLLKAPEAEVTPASYAACRSMDAFPVMTADSGVACVTQAVLVADTVPPDSLQGEVR